MKQNSFSKRKKKHLLNDVSLPLEWFNSSFLFKVHKDMLASIYEWAGKIRNSEKNIGLKTHLIHPQIINLCQNVAYWNSEPVDYTFLEQACSIHHTLALIHPFEDGNGRFCRLIADRYLKAYKCRYPIWPDNLHQDCNARKKYIEALREADKGNFEPLIAFTQAHGASDPKLGEFFGNRFYSTLLKGDRMLFMGKGLLRRGADPNDPSWNGHLPLQLAIKSSHEKLALLLIDSGAKIDIPDQSGQTPFQVAVAMGNKGIADILRTRGARPLIPPGIGYSQYYTLYGTLP